VGLKDLIRILFEELDSIWLKFMWDGDEDIRHSMIEIVHLVYLLNTRPSILMFIYES
jgi:hypothetical protein